jgi:hypothetical protein
MKISGYNIWAARELPLIKIKSGDLISFERSPALDRLSHLLISQSSRELFFAKGELSSKDVITSTLPGCALKSGTNFTNISDGPFVMSVESVRYPIKADQLEGIEINFREGASPIKSISCFLRSRAGTDIALDQILFIHLLLTIGIEGRPLAN